MNDRFEQFLAVFDALPVATFRCASSSKTYILTKSQIVDGRGFKLVGDALDGSDYISCNLYRLTSDTKLFPCEMAKDKVIDFVLNIDLGTVQPEPLGDQ